MMRVLKLAGIILVVPAIGVATGGLAGVPWLVVLSLAGGAIPLVLLAAQVGLARRAGRDRAAMAAIFPGLSRSTVYGLIAMVTVQTVVALAAMWIAEIAVLGSIHVGIMVALGAAAVAAAWGLIKAAFESGRRPALFAVGRLLTPTEAPRLHDHVRRLAERLGAAPPQHIVVGIDSSFYVTSADVHLIGREEPLRGETLYLSSTLARLFTPAELDAVIGHELGHFRGQDTAYSLRFAPVYAGLGRAITGMLDAEGRVAWTALPALHLLGFLYDLFDEAQSAVSRERELEADQAGVEAAGPEALATSLMKIAIHADAWEMALGEPAALAPQGTGGSLPVAFVQRLSRDFDAAAWREALEAGLGAPVAHPVDTHPPIRTRLAAVGIEPSAVDIARLGAPSGACGADLIEGLDELELALSGIYLEAAEPAFAAPTLLTQVADGTHDPHRA